MDNSIIEKFPYSQKELECLAALEKMTDDEIDYSDIPKITHEEFERAIARKRAKLREKNFKIAG